MCDASPQSDVSPLKALLDELQTRRAALMLRARHDGPDAAAAALPHMPHCSFLYALLPASGIIGQQPVALLRRVVQREDLLMLHLGDALDGVGSAEDGQATTAEEKEKEREEQQRMRWLLACLPLQSSVSISQLSASLQDAPPPSKQPVTGAAATRPAVATSPSVTVTAGADTLPAASQARLPSIRPAPVAASTQSLSSGSSSQRAASGSQASAGRSASPPPLAEVLEFARRVSLTGGDEGAASEPPSPTPPASAVRWQSRQSRHSP